MQDFASWYEREIARMRKAIPKSGIGKKRPKAVRMPGDFVDKRSDPRYRAGPVIRYWLPQKIDSDESTREGPTSATKDGPTAPGGCGGLP